MAENKNYKTTNPNLNESHIYSWGINLKNTKPIKEVSVPVSKSQEYSFATAYDITPLDVVIIGKNYSNSAYAKSTGIMSTPSSELKTRTSSLSHLAEIDYAFTPSIKKAHITAASKFMVQEVNGENMKLILDRLDIYPITFMTKQMIAAITVLSFPKMATSTSLQKAKDIIREGIAFDCFNYDGVRYCNLSFDDLQTVNKDKELESFGDQFLGAHISNNSVFLDDIKSAYKDSQEDCDNALKYFKAKVYIATLAVLIRGGFVNMLQAFLNECPPIYDFIDDVIQLAKKLKSKKCMSLLEEYKGNMA